MSKFSVKKPLTVFVAVIAILVLGVAAYLKMTPDLLPNMDFPYVVIMTTYPGASPETVEEEVTKPMEQSMATLENIEQVSSTSSENYSMVLLQFAESVNLDSVGVDIQQNLAALSEGWDETVGAPYVLKINPSMLPVMVAAVSMDGMDTMDLTQLLDDSLMTELEGITGVAQISASGSISQELHVVLSQDMIDDLNETIRDAINGKLDEAAGELEDTRTELEDAQSQLEDAKSQIETGKSALASETAAGEATISSKQTELLSTKAELQDQLVQLNSAKPQLETMLSVLTALRDGLSTIDTEADAIQSEIETLIGYQETMAALEALKSALDQRTAEIEGSGLTEEEIQTQLAELEASPEYIQYQTESATLAALLAAAGLDADSIAARIAESQTALESLQTRRSELESSLSEMGFSADMLDTTIAEYETNLSSVNSGITQIETALTQLDSGMLQLQDAAKLLSAQKTSGMLELAGAAAEIAANEGTVTAALSQVESGLDTIEDNRESALKASDLNNILTLETVASILGAQNFSMPAGYVEQDGVSYMVSVGDEIETADELRELLLFDLGIEDVDPIYLGDVAAVMVTDNQGDTYAKLDGLDSIVLSFQKQSTYATAEVSNNIAARFEALEAEYDGLHFVSLMDQGDYIYMIVESILESLLIGAVFSVIILFLFLKDIRPTIITICSIPISVIFAIVLMYFSGVTINMISLCGLAVAVGMLVDNSVVVIENIYRLRAKGATLIQAAVSGATQVAGAVTASTITTVCVFVPIVFVDGITKQLFTDLALTLTYSLMASLIVSLTLVPAMASGMLRKAPNPKPGLLDRIMLRYRTAIGWCLKHKAIVLLASLALLIGSAALSLAKGFTFMPTMDMPSISATIAMPEDCTMEEAVELADEVQARVLEMDGIATVGAMMSSSGISLLSGSGGTYDVTLYITLEDQTASGAAVGKEIEAACKDLPCTVSASSAMMDMSMLTGSGITLRLYTNDMETLQNTAKQAAEVLRGVEGVQEVSDGLDEAAPALHISIDRNAAMEKGMTVAQIYMELATALTDSATATSIDLDGKNTDVIVEIPETSVMTVDSLPDFEITTTDKEGNDVVFTLGEVATVEETVSLMSISRLDQQRYLTVSATLEDGYNVTLVTAEAEQAIREANLDDSVSFVFSGENETIMEAMEQLLLMLLLGILLVYLVMVAQFQSLKSPFIVMFTIPLAFTGGFFALLICGMEVSVVSLIGFIMLTGIIVNNGIVLVDYINQLRLEGMERREAIIDAGVTRIRPILMTSLTTILGLIHMATSDAVGTAIIQPVAVVCIGGLLYATLMTLFVVPCIYDMMNKKELRNIAEEDLTEFVG